jgi:O-antigen/teichoic acid export membrane protein
MLSATNVPISPRFALALIVFTVGLVALAVLVLIALLFVRRRGITQSQDTVIRLLHNSAIPLGLQMVNRAIDFAFALALYRLLDTQKGALATYEFAAIVVTLVLGTIAEWGLNLYLTSQVARDKRAIGETFGTALALRLGLAALVIPATLLIVLVYNQLSSARVINNRFDAEGLMVMLVLAATALPGAISGAVTAVFLATERPIVPAVVGLMTNIISAMLKLGALLLGFGVLGVAAAALTATCASSLAFAVLFVRYFGKPQFQISRTMGLAMLRAGFPLMLNALLLAVFFRFDITVIRAFRAAEEFTAYTAAYKYVSLTQILPPIVINAIFPLFARQAVDNRPGLVRAYSYTTRLLLLLALPLSVAITILAPTLLTLFGDAEYINSGGPALQLLIWYLPLSYINGVTQYVLIAVNRAKAITQAFALAALFNLGFNFLFVPSYGINAAAIATVLSEIVLFIPLWRVVQAELAPVSPLRMMFRPALAAIGMGAAMLLLAQVHVLLSVVTAVPLFWALLVVFGEVQDEDRRLARRVLKRA